MLLKIINHSVKIIEAMNFFNFFLPFDGHQIKMSYQKRLYDLLLGRISSENIIK